METINRDKMISLNKGTKIKYKNKEGFITGYIDLNSVLVRESETGNVERVLIDEVNLFNEKPEYSNEVDLSLISDDEWLLAESKLEVISPLLEAKNRTRADVKKRAEEFNKHTNTIYKWIKSYERSGIRGLMKKFRKDSGVKRLDEKIEKIIQENIEDYYLTKERRSVAYVHRVIVTECKNLNLKPPHENTIRKRIDAISQVKQLAKRFGHNKAAEKFEPIRGHFPGAETPFSVYQMDHTLLDIIVVDEEDRRPVGTPTITMIIDVYSRMVAGFSISFEPPGALTAGLCLANAILPKDAWTNRYQTKDEWPIWGVPSTLHMDNAGEFRGKMLRYASLEYQFSIEYRPVARPNYGGHIERLLGTLSQELKSLPGSKYSNTQERANYPAEKRAAFSLDELEEWLTVLIVDGYHQKLHSSIEDTPIQKFKKGVIGSSSQPGVGLRPKITDSDRVKIDFLPIIERSISNEGVVIDNIHYYHDVLRHWINTKDPENKKLNRKFIFRRDPRDISSIWFYDPELRQYFPIPYRDLSRPNISLWELRKARQSLLKINKEKRVSEFEIFDTYERMREIEQNSVKKTLASRRSKARKKDAQKKVIREESNNTNNSDETFIAKNNITIEPFDGLMDDFDET